MSIQTSLSRPEGVHPNIFAEVLAIKAGYEGDPWEFVQVVMQELLELRNAANGKDVRRCNCIECRNLRNAVAKADARLGTAIKEGK